MDANLHENHPRSEIPREEIAGDEGTAATGKWWFPAKMLRRGKENLVFRRSPWWEVNGAMGDLGTYIPIVLALTLANGLDLGTTLIFTGLYNIATGLIYGVPMPVQPMKSIAAVAISSGPDFNVQAIMAAGICTASILLFLGLTGFMQCAYNLIPLPVVRGIQLSQGLSFSITAIKYIWNIQHLSKPKIPSTKRPWWGSDGLALAIASACLIVVLNGVGQDSSEEQNNQALESSPQILERPKNIKKKILRLLSSLPSAIIVFLLGVILAIVRRPSVVKEIDFGPSKMALQHISVHDWKVGFLKGAIPQIPLSVLNSVIAVCKLCSDLFPRREFSATSVSVSVGVMNFVGCWFGAMPCCHGAGGLAGQYKFGGRSGGCVAALGAAKVVLGVVLGSSLVMVLNEFPVGILGVLLLFAGLELAMVCRDVNSKEESFVMLACASVSLVGSSAAIGFGCGIVVHALLKLRMLLKRVKTDSYM